MCALGVKYDFLVMKMVIFILKKYLKFIVDVLEITADEEFLDERMNSIKSVFNNTFWNGEAYYYETSNELPDDRAQAIPVLAGMVEEDIKKYYDPTHNHAWASCALVGLSGYGAGVYPIEAGYETWRIAPQMEMQNLKVSRKNTIKSMQCMK